MARILDLTSYELFTLNEECVTAAPGAIAHFRTQEDHLFSVEVRRVVEGRPGTTLLAPCARQEGIDPCQMVGHFHGPTALAAEGQLYFREILLIADTDADCRELMMHLSWDCPRCAKATNLVVSVLDMMNYYWGAEQLPAEEIFTEVDPAEVGVFSDALCRGCRNETI